MSYIPDCRTDENYNEKYLNEKDKLFIAGYDWAVNEMSIFFDNLNVYPEVETILADDTAIITEGKADKVKEAIEEWVEMSRDELITSMIDGMDGDEYEKIKAEVDKEG